MKTTTFSGLLFVAILLVNSCSRPNQTSISSHFSLPSSEYSQLRTRSAALKVGMSEAQVIALLGHPNVRYVEAPKTELSAGMRKVVFIYDVERREIGKAYDSDKYLRLEFNSSKNALMSVLPRNLPDFNAVPTK